MKKGNPLFKTIIVLGLGALLAYFGLNVSQEQIEEVVDGVVSEVSTQTQSEPLEQAGVSSYTVSSVIDGDTFTAMVDGEKETVRVLGMNTPETEFSSRGAECFGTEATEYAKTLLQGVSIQLTSDDSQDTHDKYNRMLAFATLPDGRDFGQVMIADGYAYEYTYKGIPHKKQQVYRKAQAQAQEDEVGLWAESACTVRIE